MELAGWPATTQALKRKLMRQVGTRVQTTYRPGDVFQRPPGPGDVTLELLLASQAHMGHHTSLWNPANARYIFGVRQGIHVISLEQTAAHLRRAARVVEEVAYRGGLILFVGTRPGHTQIVTQAARLARACHLFTKWVPGSITNSDVSISDMIGSVFGNSSFVEDVLSHWNVAKPSNLTKRSQPALRKGINGRTAMNLLRMGMKFGVGKR